jgi:hypothetical protein
VIDLENATTRLYEDATLTEDLIDEEANALLKWAEAQLPALVSKFADADEAAFEEAFTALRTFVKSMNRLVGQGSTMEDSEKQQRMEKIASAAAQLGYPVDPAQGAAVVAEQAASAGFSAQQAGGEHLPSNVETINALLSWVSAAGAGQADARQPATSAPAETPGESSPTPTAPTPTSAPNQHHRTLKDVRNDQEE